MIAFEPLEIRPLTTVILQEGYRHFDAAWFYRGSGGKRNRVQLTPRVPQGPRNSSVKPSKRQVFLVRNSSSPLSSRASSWGKLPHPVS